MTIWTGFSSYLNRFNILIVPFIVLLPFSTAESRALQPQIPVAHYQDARSDTTNTDSTANITEYPDPESVLYKSLILPGWGQVVNRQAWKVPVVYAMLGGIGWYSIYLTKRYHDYRAAFYNATSDTDDFRFGQTPGYISPTASPESLRNTRDRLRNRRDFAYIALALAYGLNVLDAYVYAHMRTFDVSEDLSLRTEVKPVFLTEQAVPGVSVSVELFNRSQLQ